MDGSANDSGGTSAEQERKMTGAGESEGQSKGEGQIEGEGQSEGEGDSAGKHREERATVAAPARVDPLSLRRLDGDVQRLEPERYKVQFTATEEYVRLVEEAKALLSHAVPNVPLEELQLRAMRVLVAELKKKKYATIDSSPARAREPETVEVLLRAASGTRRERGDALEQHAQATDALDEGAEQ